MITNTSCDDDVDSTGNDKNSETYRDDEIKIQTNCYNKSFHTFSSFANSMFSMQNENKNIIENTLENKNNKKQKKKKKKNVIQAQGEKIMEIKKGKEMGM